MTTKTVVGMLAVMWGIAAILATVMIATEPVHIIWPQALVVYHYKILSLFAVPQLILIVSIVAANVFSSTK